MTTTYDLGSLLRFYATINDDVVVGINRKWLNLRSMLFQPRRKQSPNLFEKVQIVLDVYAVQTLNRFGMECNFLNIKFLSKCWGFAKLHWKDYEKELEEIAANMNTTTDSLTYAVIGIFLQQKPLIVLEATELNDSDPDIMMPDIGMDNMSSHDYRERLQHISTHRSPRKVDIPGTKYSNSFERDYNIKQSY